MARARPLLLFAVVQCTATTPAPQRPAGADEPPPPAHTDRGGDEFLVGVLGEVGIVECPDGATRRWSDVRPVIGWTPVTLAGAADAELFERPVLARGAVGEDPHESIEHAPGPDCPAMQMRSDMVETPRGVRLRRDAGTRLPHFRVDELRPLAELTARAADGEIAIDFRNPLPVELQDVDLVVHYEGCHGKPGTARRHHAVGTLAAGAGARASFPALVDAERGPGRLEPHRASSVQILATGERAHFDLDVYLSVIGAATQCPNE